MPKLPEKMKNPVILSNFDIAEFLELNDIGPYKIYSRDDKKTHIPSGEFFCVINLGDRDGMGTHWCGMYSDEDKAYYYDPYGLPCPTEIIDWVKKQNNMRLFYIDNQHQPNLSNLCGYYVCYFLYSMDKGMPVSTYMNLFNPDGDEGNDVKLLKYFHIYRDTKVTEKTGKGIDAVKILNNILPNAELHMHDIKFNDYGLPVGFEKHSFTGPNTNLQERIENIDELMQLPNMEDITFDKIKYKTLPIDDSIDRYASIHDLMYHWGEKNTKTKEDKLKAVHSADKILQDNAYKTMRDGKAPIQKRIQGALVSLVMSLKQKFGLGMKKQQQQHPEILFLNKHLNEMNKKQIRILNSLKM